jgi:hypothetical protein
MLFPAMGLGIQAASEPRLNAEAAAFFSFARAFGQAIGVAMSGVIFQNVFKQKLLAIPEWADKASECRERPSLRSLTLRLFGVWSMMLTCLFVRLD